MAAPCRGGKNAGHAWLASVGVHGGCEGVKWGDNRVGGLRIQKQSRRGGVGHGGKGKHGFD